MAQGPVRNDDPASGAAPGAATAKPAGSRRGLFLPYILLAALALVWTVAWFMIRARAEREIDGWLAAEATAGRQWTCTDRSLTGFPFRLELRCASLAFARSDGRFSLGPVTALVQVYAPRHAIFEIGGPFKVQQGELTADATWDKLEGSFHGASGGFSRVSLVADRPRGSVTGAAPEPVTFSVRHLETHARPTPGRFETDGAVDVNLSAKEVALPLVDALAGSGAPADLALDATINRAASLRTGRLDQELERWRQAGGSLDVALLSVVKGDSRLQARGSLGLDEAHRLMGKLDLRTAGLESLVTQVVGRQLGADRGALIGGLVGKLLGNKSFGAPAEDAAPQAGGTPLKALPPLKFAEGRMTLGPFVVPNVALTPLY